MCLIAYVNAGSTFPQNKIDVVTNNNPDGFGMMWVEHNKFRYIKGLFKTDEISYMIKDGPKDRVAYHWRFATKGEVTEENAHPFIIDDKIGVMHNGTMSRIKPVDGKSDSAIFVSGLEKTYNKYGTPLLFSSKIRAPIESMIGMNNKLFMMGIHKGRMSIRFFNAKEWHTEDGVAYSNKYSFIRSLRNPISYYGDNWSSDYYGYNNSKNALMVI